MFFKLTFLHQKLKRRVCNSDKSTIMLLVNVSIGLTNENLEINSNRKMKTLLSAVLVEKFTLEFIAFYTSTDSDSCFQQ